MWICLNNNTFYVDFFIVGGAQMCVFRSAIAWKITQHCPSFNLTPRMTIILPRCDYPPHLTSLSSQISSFSSLFKGILTAEARLRMAILTSGLIRNWHSPGIGTPQYESKKLENFRDKVCSRGCRWSNLNALGRY